MLSLTPLLGTRHQQFCHCVSTARVAVGCSFSSSLCTRGVILPPPPHLSLSLSLSLPPSLSAIFLPLSLSRARSLPSLSLSLATNSEQPSTKISWIRHDHKIDDEACQDASDRVQDAVFDGVKRAAAAPPLTDTIDCLPFVNHSPERPYEEMGRLLQKFLLGRFHSIVPFAAVKYQQNGPGALIIYSRTAIDDLVILEQLRPLDRQVLCLWAQRSSKRGLFSAQYLQSFCPCSTLDFHIERNSNTKTFPLLLITSPDAAEVPPELRDLLRPAKRNRGARAYSGVLVMQYFDYDAVLELGSRMPYAQSEVYNLNFDREKDEPTQ